jgi:hypothetical protein
VDRTAARLAAVALVGLGRHAEAASAMVAAEREDGRLAAAALDGRDLIPASGALRRMVNDAVVFAREHPGAAGWTLVAVLMEAEGRAGVAAKMRARAAEAGAGEGAGDAEPAEKRSPGPATYRVPE